MKDREFPCASCRLNLYLARMKVVYLGLGQDEGDLPFWLGNLEFDCILPPVHSRKTFHIRKFYKMCQNIVRFRFYCRIATKSTGSLTIKAENTLVDLL